jgi:hypothetical protein
MFWFLTNRLLRIIIDIHHFPLVSLRAERRLDQWIRPIIWKRNTRARGTHAQITTQLYDVTECLTLRGPLVTRHFLLSLLQTSENKNPWKIFPTARNNQEGYFAVRRDVSV